MKIKTYFLFPETDDDFIRIGDDPQSYIDLINEVAIIKQQLKSHRDYELCYDANNMNLFLTKAESLIEGNYLAHCRTQLNILFGSFSRNISTTFLRKTDCLYVSWNIDCTIKNANKLLSEATEAKINEGQDKIILINISNAHATNRDSVHIIKDAIHYNELPEMVTFLVVNNEIEFSEWYSTLTAPDFSLRDKRRFQITPHRWEKQSIYIEIATGCYWYYDYFHRENKRHYEVFNSQGVHLGEADIMGVLNTSKADSSKHIDNIIN